MAWGPKIDTDPLADVVPLYHPAIVGFVMLKGLDIRECAKCEGGGFMIRQDQAERIYALIVAARSAA